MVGKSFILAMTVVFLALVNSYAAGDWQSFPVCDLGYEQTAPSVSGDSVVWTDKRSGGYDIYSYNLAEPNEYPVCTAGGDQKEPVISNDIVVWTDNDDIFGYDLRDSVAFIICEDDVEQECPAISGNIVVYRDKRNYTENGFDIYGCDISDKLNPNEFQICTQGHSQYYPDISGDVVVWIDTRNDNPDVYGYDLSDEQEFEICLNTSGQYYPKVSGDMVVWLDDRNGHSDIYGYRISTQTEFPICTHSDSKNNPAISGNLVVWQDKRNGDTNSDIYGYDISSGIEFAICTAAGNQINPVIDGDTVVWQHNTGSSADIYCAYRPVPSVLTIIFPDGGEMLRADTATDISWQSSGPVIDTVRLEYSVDDGGNWDIITLGTANTGLYDWDPIPAENSDQCLIRISDFSDSGACDVSDGVFTIFECSESLIADLNGDCFVDMEDFALFCQQWLQGGNPYDL